jgi:signal transduction histidine kinase
VTVGILNKLLYSLLGIFTLVVPALMLRKAIKHSMGEVKKMLQVHLIGIFLLAVPATFAASLGITNPCIQSAISKNLILIFGFPFFGIVVTLVFIQRFILLIKDRQVAFEKLETAYTELDQANSLKEIGQSTAIINHEIKNFTFGISANIQLILDYDKQLVEASRRKLSAIVDTTKRMSDFSMDILELSKAKILKEKVELSISGVIERCIESHFPSKKQDFVFSGFEKNHSIHGDWNKLDHVFLNIFKNAFEADATSITIRAIESPTVLLLTIEDNGAGCNEKAVKQLFTAFYTTKKNSRGTGLGMPIIKSIVESHGGYISAYSKNLMEGSRRGLILNLCFPIYSSINARTDIPNQNVVLVKEGIENIGPIIRVFQNVHFTPHIVQSIEDVIAKEFPPEEMMILAIPKNIIQLQKRSEKFKAFALIAKNETPPTIMNITRESLPEAFSEEYVIENFVMLDREAA